MLFDAENGDRGLVYDADGVLIAWPIRGNTETGEVVIQCRTESGHLRWTDPREIEILKETRFYQPPLRMEPIPDGWVNPFAPVGPKGPI